MELTLKEMLMCIHKALCYLANDEDIDWVLPRIQRVLRYLSDLPKGDDRDFIEGIRAFFVNYRDLYRRTGIRKSDAAANWANIVKRYIEHMD